MARPFKMLSEREILALAIAAEEEESWTDDELAAGLRRPVPKTAEASRGSR